MDFKNLKAQPIKKRVASIKLINEPFKSHLLVDKFFTEIDICKNGGEIINYFSLEELENRINSFKKEGKSKNEHPTILKGIYTDGIKSSDCSKPSPFLFFDIDVKNVINKHLKNPSVNQRVFNFFQKISLLTYRSYSQEGIAGILYVPQLVKIGDSHSRSHQIVGNAIYKFLKTELKSKLEIEIEFDESQANFRQGRYLAEQQYPVELNKEPLIFNYELKEELELDDLGVVQYKFTSNTISTSIIEKYNTDADIRFLVQQAGFNELNKSSDSIRLRHSKSLSYSTGFVDLKDNTYMNYSETFGGKKKYDAFEFSKKFLFNGDFESLVNDLRVQGYDEIIIDERDFEDGLNYLSNHTSQDEVAKVCYHLRKGTVKQKSMFFQEVRQLDIDETVLRSYLGYNQIEIVYDKSYKIKGHIGGKIKSIIEDYKNEDKIILRAETGTGKTTAFLKFFPQFFPEKKILILEPLTAIVDQSKNDYPNLTGLTGISGLGEFQQAYEDRIVMATYEKGITLLKDQVPFDYIIVDEIHNLLVANGYKPETISQLTWLLKDKKVIGLTGTPSNIFSSLGYKLINLENTDRNVTEVIQRVSNKEAEKIILNHLNFVEGKVIIRVNSEKVLKSVKQELIELKRFEENQILILHSDFEIKKSEDFKLMAEKGKFRNNVRVVLTTGVIDEGVSLYQEGFTDVVFIENDYRQRPESIKQFFARFRHIEPQRKNYHYFKMKNNQDFNVFNEANYFKNQERSLKRRCSGDFTTYTDLSEFDKYFYVHSCTINPFFLAYKTTNITYSSFNHEEYNSFLETNYDLKVRLDASWTMEEIDISEIKESRKVTKETIDRLWLKETEMCIDAVLSYSRNEEIQNYFNFKGMDKKICLYSFVQDELKDFESLCVNFIKLKKVGLKNIEMFRNGKKRGQEAITNLIKIQNLKNLLDNPKNDKDRDLKHKFQEFILQLKQKKSFEANEMKPIWYKIFGKEIGLTQKSLIKLLKEDFSLTEDKYHLFKFSDS
ncbi:DEAD/DEAH box helicase family protein [Autumnicola psychrophila]|uniref:DEAD/DEAH box helicase family protein n=1 Tax=Autumnicola psychrophila TaxID=3075592 RepID=A0ABU3DPD4_9FLAO|nr:DEAD/DEAH box helicase family protein [Zunongwangia sp. F225]MDT0685563.1 DEAD/DEAH box helicase family protein [Zunongwangia sp. F225]